MRSGALEVLGRTGVVQERRSSTRVQRSNHQYVQTHQGDKTKRRNAAAGRFGPAASLVLACWFSFGLAAVPASGQVVKGSISGTVVDATGAVVPGAEIAASNRETGAQYSTVTDQSGLFHIALVGIGSYTVEVRKTGFRALTLGDVSVQASQDAALGNLTLEIGQATTSVEVTAAPPLMETTQAQVTNTVSSSTIQSFPGINLNNGLDVLALQTPGVVATRDLGFSNSNGMDFGNNGIRGRNNDQQIDGQNNNDNSVAGPSLFMTNPDFVQEYQIVTENFGPEYGRNSGSVVNIVTKSGTNNWHGDAFITESNWRLSTLSNTQKAFEGLTQVPVFNNEFSGVSIGGPLKKDKAFIFGGFDNNIIPGSAVYAEGGLTPTPAGISALQGCFPNSPSISALANYGPYGIKGGNPVPSGTPTTQTLMAADGSPCSVQFAGVQRTLPDPVHQYDYTARIDWNGVKDHVYGRWLYQKITSLNLDPGTAALGYPFNEPSFSEDFGVSWTRTLSSTMVNELRLSYGRLTVEFGGNGIGNTIPNQGNIASGLADISIGTPFAGFGPPDNFPSGRIVNTYQLQDNWSWFHGAHQIKAGTNLTYQRSPNVFLPFYNGGYTFTDFQGFADNMPESVNVTQGTPNLDFREHDSFFYVGDDYKARPNLTLNLGLTYTYFGQPANLFNQLDTKRESGSEPFFDPSLPLSVRVFPSLPAPKNQFGPSAGFAYTPHWGGRLTGNGQTVLRGGYRLAYDPPYYNIYLNIAGSAPQVLAQTIAPTTASDGSVIPAPPLPAQPFGPNVRSDLAPYLTLGTQDPRSFNQTTVTPNFRADHVQQWSLGIQRQLTPAAVFEARYVGNHGGNLFQSVNANPYIGGLAATFPSLVPSGDTPCPASQAVVSQAVGRVNCNLGVDRVRTNTAVSDYQALQTELRTTNLAHQLTLRTAYTWSKTTANADEIYATGGAGGTLAFSQNPFDYLGGEHGLSGLDIPQNWTLSFVEQIPVYRDQHGLAGHLLGGWSVSGSYIIASGQPYTPIQFYLNTFSGPNQYYDTNFNAAFATVYETARPFAGSSSAPVNTVGIYAGDVCGFYAAACSVAPGQLLNFNAFNASGAIQNATPSQVRFIANGQEADSIYGTVYGNVGRNVARDYQTNTANFALFKDTQVTERVKAQFRMDMVNVFNHPNFSSVDPFIEDAGLTQETTGFGTPSLYPGTTSTFGQRQITFELKLFF
ncbi:MAG TPA: TonB-dependent receptor [Terriglobia bacterium]|nr:TonB-dependent receptor [Terriglobia bacterium]